MFAPSAPRMLSMPAEKSNLSQRASNLRVNHAAAPNTIRSEIRNRARTSGKGEAAESSKFIGYLPVGWRPGGGKPRQVSTIFPFYHNIAFRANQYLCVAAH